MNFRNKYAVIVVRTLLGLLFLMSGIGGLMTIQSMKGIPETMLPAMQILKATGIIYMIKVTETVAGLMLLVGFLPALAAIFLAPICVGIVIFHARMEPSFLIPAVVIGLFLSYLGYAYWDKYKALFTR